MTTRTRRRVLVSLVVLALTLPAESILLKAVTAPNVKDAAKQYVSSLSASQLQAAAGTIESFPYSYRRQIMAAVTPDVQARVWQNHIALYEQSHALDARTVGLLDAIKGLITPESVIGPSSEEKLQVLALITAVQSSIGRDDARMLFEQLGPADTSASVAEPLSEQLANYVRRAYVVLADIGDPCGCNLDFGCNGTQNCMKDSSCPTEGSGCGWFWWQVCNGTCGFGEAGNP